MNTSDIGHAAAYMIRFTAGRVNVSVPNVPSHVVTLPPRGEYDSTCASFDPPELTTQTAN